jgi:putative thiamine transport system permease protein
VTESALAGLGRRWCERGGRRGWVEPLAAAAAAAGAVVLGLGLASLAVMAVWSVAVSWRYPRLLPDGWSLAIWLRQGPGMAAAFGTTLGLALSTSAVALAAAVACLEGERYTRRGLTGRALWLVYTPLLVPQIAFLYGFQVVLVRCGWDGGWLAVAWAHLVFVLPYVWLSLADPWRALDPRYARSAAALGVSPWRALWRLQLPLLLQPLCVAYAVGCAVSVGLYLPTLFAGAGRVTTLATEAVALSSGGDRRVVGVYAFALAALPLAVYGAALAAPALRRRRRRRAEPR